MTTNLPRWLIYCRPGFEHDCIEETQAKPIRAEQNSGYLILEGKPKLDFRKLTFTRQLLRLHGEVDTLPEHDRLTPLLTAIPDVPEKFSAVWLETPDTNEGKTLSGFTRRFQPLLEDALMQQERITQEANAPRLHIFFPDKHSALIASSDPHNSSAAHMGIQRVSMSPDAPSRSYLKLAEAFETFLNKSEQAKWLKPGMTAVDLGAAPGGWTWQLVQRGLKVTAVDNGPLKGAAHGHPAIRHLRQDGFRFRPQRPVDWLVCDMVEQPQRVAALMAEWFAGGHTQRAIFNLKLPMKKRVAALQESLGILQNALKARGINCRLETRQLYHDREEITVFCSRDKR